MRTLYLHLGPAKTGTSALQHILRHHDNTVVCYPKVGLWSDGSHHNLIFNFFEDYKRPEVVREDAGRLLASIAREARSSNRDLVISSEILAGRKNLNDFVEALQRHLGEEPLRVEILVTVREHFERAASLYNQRVKDGAFAETRDPDVFLAENAGNLCYANLLRRLRRTGFDLTVTSYHPANTFVARALGHLGFAPQHIVDAPARNVSLGTKALVAMLAVNRVARTAEERNRLVSTLRRFLRSRAPAQFIFLPEAAAAAEQKFSLDRQFLREQFAVELPVPQVISGPRAFTIDAREFTEISKAASRFGDRGNSFREAIRPYVRAGTTS